MIRKIVAVGVAAGLALAGMAGAPAMAQTSWSFDGVSIPPRAGWCPTTTAQYVPGGGSVQALEVRPCGSDFPYLSVGVAARGMPAADVAALTNQAAVGMEGDLGRKNMLEIFQRKSASCTIATYNVDRAPLPGLTAVALTSSANCPALGTGPVWFRNFATFVKRKNGDLWAVAFDYPLAPMTEADKQMIRGAIAIIQAN
jgi:hypothetical protein